MTKTITTAAELTRHIVALKSQGKTIGFVPTMGALHDGHVSLVEIAQKNADIVVVSIFVNPAQFAPHEDFDSYPRMVEKDVAMLAEKAVDVVYLPTKEEIYPNGIDPYFTVGAIGQILEGKPRPHFFDGVGQVVLRLFAQTLADVAVFGEKDYQQLTIIRKIVQENGLKLNIIGAPIIIIGAPIIREKDGLAMSSRNMYLNETVRKISPLLYNTLLNIAEKIRHGEKQEHVLARAVAQLLAGGFEQVDYIEICDSITLKPWDGSLEKPARILAAARLNAVRLIDNIEL